MAIPPEVYLESMLKKSEDAFANAGQGLMAVAAANRQSAERRDAEQRAAENRKAEMALQAFYNKQAMGDQQAFMRQMAEDTRKSEDARETRRTEAENARAKENRDFQIKQVEAFEQSRNRSSDRERGIAVDKLLADFGINADPTSTTEEKEGMIGQYKKMLVNDGVKGLLDRKKFIADKVRESFAQLDQASINPANQKQAINSILTGPAGVDLKKSRPDLYNKLADGKMSPFEVGSELSNDYFIFGDKAKSNAKAFLTSYQQALEGATGKNDGSTMMLMSDIQNWMKQADQVNLSYNEEISKYPYLINLKDLNAHEAKLFGSPDTPAAGVKPPGIVTPPPPDTKAGGGAGVVTPPIRPSVPPSTKQSAFSEAIGGPGIMSGVGEVVSGITAPFKDVAINTGIALGNAYDYYFSPANQFRADGAKFSTQIADQMEEAEKNRAINFGPQNAIPALIPQSVRQGVPQVVQPVQAQPSGPGFFERLRRGVVEPAARRIMQPMAQEEVPTTTQSPTPMSHLDIAAQTGHLKNVFGVDDATAQKMVEIYAADRQAPVEQVYGEVAQILQKAQLGDQAALQTVSTYKERARRGY